MKSLRRKETQFIHYIHLRKYNSPFCCWDSLLLFVYSTVSPMEDSSWDDFPETLRWGKGPGLWNYWSVIGWSLPPGRGLPQGEGFPRERPSNWVGTASFCWEQCLERDSAVRHRQAVFLEAGGMRAFILKAQLCHTTYFRVVLRTEWDISCKTAIIVCDTLEILIKWQLLYYQPISIEYLPINKEGVWIALWTLKMNETFVLLINKLTI